VAVGVPAVDASTRQMAPVTEPGGQAVAAAPAEPTEIAPFGKLFVVPLAVKFPVIVAVPGATKVEEIVKTGVVVPVATSI